MSNSTLGIDLGYLFEVGFNIGMLTYIQQKDIKNNYSDRYKQDLQQVNFTKIVRKLIEKENIISQQHREIIKQWAIFFLQKSFLAGINFLDEYFTAIDWNKSSILKRLEVVYFQCDFANDNSLRTYYKSEAQVYQDWFAQFEGLGIDTYKYKQTGEFLKADSLIYLRYKHQVRILVLDYSIFAIKSIRDLADLNNIEVLRQILLSDISYFKSKSVFANLGLDSQHNRFTLSKSLAQYYKAFVKKDKETIKTIQAGSYAYSFWNWLNTQQQILPEDKVTFNIIGYSDRDFASLCINQDNIQFLETCHHIYSKKDSESDISYNRKQLLNIIKRKAQRSFTNGEQFIQKLLKVSEDGIHLVTHQETFTDFKNYRDTIPSDIAQKLNISSSLNLQEAHGELIEQALASDKNNLYVFLTGNPGIGKTTAISNFLKQNQIIEEGFLFFYISPRVQVNIDIVEKFKISSSDTTLSNLDDNTLCDDQLIVINTNSNLIDNNQGKLTVQYCSNTRDDKFRLQAVDFIPLGAKTEFTVNQNKNVTRKTATRLKQTNNGQKGVLYSISEAIYSLLNDGHNNIVATVAIQSLKKLSNGKDTLDHFKRIFRDVYNDTEGKIIEAKLQQLSKKVKHIFIAIDEITGDQSGVEFLLGISKQLKQYGLTNRNYFNTKIIVADASIIDSNVIQQHLSQKNPEPNKIFFMEVIQVIYRGRGNPEIDAEDKQLIFYLTEQAVYYDEENRNLALQESKLNILDFLIILHTSIKTRIYGYGNIANKKYMMIPVGGKSVFTAGESLSNQIKTLIKKLKKEHQKRSHDERLQRAYLQLEELMKTAEITIESSVKSQTSYLDLLDNVRQNFIKLIDGNLDKLLSFPPIQIGYVTGNLLLVPLANQKVSEVHRLKIDEKTITLGEILLELKQDYYLSDNTQALIYKTLQLIEKLEEQEYRNQRLEHESEHEDRYYAVPLLLFLVGNVFSTYFKHQEIEPEDQRFRDILESYVYSMFPISQVMPIGYKYKNIPFLVFRSYSLKEMRDKKFSDKYLINSKELNILNLILAQSEINQN